MNLITGEYPKYNPSLIAAKPRRQRGKQKEGSVVNACMRWLFLNGCYAWVNKTGGWKDSVTGRVIKYGLKGSSDIIAVRNGKLICVECKSASGRMEPEQKLFRDRIQEKGGIYILARSVDDLEKRKAEIMA